MEVHNLNAISPRIPEIATERRREFQSVFFHDLVTNLRQLGFVPDNKAKVTHSLHSDILHLEESQKLVISQLKKSITLSVIQFFQPKDILIERHRLLNIPDLQGHVVAAENLNTPRKKQGSGAPQPPLPPYYHGRGTTT